MFVKKCVKWFFMFSISYFNGKIEKFYVSNSPHIRVTILWQEKPDAHDKVLFCKESTLRAKNAHLWRRAQSHKRRAFLVSENPNEQNVRRSKESKFSRRTSWGFSGFVFVYQMFKLFDLKKPGASSPSATGPGGSTSRPTQTAAYLRVQKGGRPFRVPDQ